MVSSFGRREEPPASEPAGLPVIGAANIMIVPVVDEDALLDVYAQIRRAVAAAVRAGFVDATSDPDTVSPADGP